MTQTQTPTLMPARWERHRDKYGRTCHTLHGYNTNGEWRALCSLVRLPKTWTEGDGRADQKYLANDWLRKGTFGQDSVSYHRTLKAAKAHLLTIHPQAQGMSEFSA